MEEEASNPSDDIKALMAQVQQLTKDDHHSLPPSSNNCSRESSFVYVRKWVQSRHCKLFRLTNDTIQVNYFDGTKLMLSREGQVVT